MKIANVDVKDLVNEYQTPLYVYDEEKIEKVMKEYSENFRSDKFDTLVLYASKAFSCKAMLQLVNKNNLGLDVVSKGEAYTAYKSDFNMEKVFFHGNNKTEEEINLGLDFGIKNFVVDNYMELEELEEIAGKKNKKINVLLRLNVGIEAHTHKYIVTSHIDSKFGMLIDSEEYHRCLDFISKSQNLVLDGFHSHIGSQIFDLAPYLAAIDKISALLTNFDKKLTINLGGGFGIKYTEADNPIPYKDVCKTLIKYLEKQKNVNKIKRVIIEPGRSIVGEAGYTLYKVGNLKKTVNKSYLFIDGGMTDNIRPALYQALYNADIVEKIGNEKNNLVTVAGKCCESGDIIIENIMLQDYEKNDTLVVYSTGAYGYSMSSNYNRNLIPAVVFVNNGKSRLVVKRQTLDELIGSDF